MRFEKDMELLILEDIIQLEQVRAFLTYHRGVLSDRLKNINYWINMEQPQIEPPKTDGSGGVIFGIIAVSALTAVGYFAGKLIDWILGGILGFLALLVGLEDVNVSIPLILAVLGAILGVYILISTIQDDADYNSKSKAEYYNMLDRDAQITKNKRWANDQLKPVTESIGRVNEEIEIVDSKLAKVYSLNMLPKQYRSYQAAKYIYDFISSSPYDIEQAMPDFRLSNIEEKLNIIIARLNEIIRQNDISILQQIQTNASLSKIEMQNRGILDKMEQVQNVSEQELNTLKVLSVQNEVITYLSLGTYLNTLHS